MTDVLSHPESAPHAAAMTACEPLQKSSLLRDLPALPAAVLELLDMLGSEDIETAVLVSKIALDPALTAKTLRLANSSFYGISRHVGSVGDATTVLGLRTVRAVVTAAAMSGSFAPPDCAGFDFKAFWRHAVGVAAGAKLVACAAGVEADAAFTAGLLHDIGRLVLASAFAPRFERTLIYACECGVEPLAAERALLGTDHAAVGAIVTEHWRFPACIVEAIGQHHAPPASGCGARLAHVVGVADRLVQAIESGGAGWDELPAEAQQAWVAIGLANEAWAPLLAETELQMRGLCAALLN
jgi:putative nucleotidyltransferase with HDIG domain